MRLISASLHGTSAFFFEKGKEILEADKKTYRDLHELIVGPVERAPRFE